MISGIPTGNGMGLRDMIRQIFRLAFVSIAGLIIYLSLVPHLPLPDLSNIDKVEHLLAYFALQLSGGIAFKRPASIWFVLIFCICLGLSMEIAQLYVPGREASMADMIANMLGIALALVTLAFRGRYTRTPTRKA